jgi:hypothetical protein
VPPQTVYFQTLEADATWYGIVLGPDARLDIPEGSLLLRNAVFTIPGVAMEEVQVATAITGEQTLEPEAFQLQQNFPNPFNGRTTIPFELPEQVPVRLVVYNALGQVARVLVDEVRQPGWLRGNLGRP